MEQLLHLGAVAIWTDAQLLDRFAADGDEAAFEALVERHGPMVMRVCRSVLRDPHEAQDAFQATFLVLLRNRATIRRPEALASWLHGVARRVSARARREASHRRVVERAATSRREAHELPEWCPELHEEIDSLPERYRAAVVLCGLEGKTHEEAAHLLGWPVGTLKVRLMRGRARLRARLVRRGLAPLAAAFCSMGGDASAHTPVSPSAAQIGTVSIRAEALARVTSRSLFMARLNTLLISIFVAGTVLSATGWGLHRTLGASDLPQKTATQTVVGQVEKDLPKPNYESLQKDLRVGQMGNMRPPVKDEHGVHFQSREAVLNNKGEVWLLDPWKKGVVAGPLLHGDQPIQSINFLDGAGLLLTHSKESMRIWDGKTGQFKGEMTGQNVTMIDYSCSQRDGKLVTIASDEQVVTVWDPETLKAIGTLKTAPHRVQLTALSSNGKTLATVGSDRSVQLWDIASSKCFATIEAPAAILDLIFTREGKPDIGKFKEEGSFWSKVASLLPAG
jgi:RNA polymerase sigma factor (sigma-70 family)